MPLGYIGQGFCPECRRKRMEQVLDYLGDIWESNMDPRLNPSKNPEAGQEFLRRTMLGLPSNVGQAMKPSKFIWEELGGPEPKKKRKRTANGKKRSKLMSKNLKIANKRGRKKNGEYKKGWGQSRIMSTAHKMTRRDMR